MQSWLYIVMLVAVFAIMYFLMIRPQNKKAKEEKKMRDSIQVGDDIVTIGGIYGKIVSIKEDCFVIESPVDHSKIKLEKSAIARVLTIHE